MNIPFIGAGDVEHLLTWPEIADAIESGHSRPKARIRDALLRQAPNGCLNRAAWIDGLGIGLKSMTVFPGNVDRDPPLPTIQGMFILFDDENGGIKALIDGVLLTKWKTAGDSVLGARLLARGDSTRLLIVGAGTVARSLVEAYASVIPTLDDIRIWNRTAARAEALAEEMARMGFATRAASDLESAVAAADIISCATTTSEPVLRGDWILPGTHVDAIGAYTPDMREVDDALLAKARIFVDSRDTTVHEIGELTIPMAAGVISESDIVADFYDLRAGGEGRASADDITFFKNGGGAHLDLMTAEVIHRKFAAGA